MTYRTLAIGMAAGTALLASAPAAPVQASSHMDAPLITFDDAANTTDVYAFVSRSGGTEYLTTAVSVYPFEEPGIGSLAICAVAATWLFERAFDVAFTV